MHLCLFFLKKLRFSLFSFISFSFKMSLLELYSLLKVHNHALSWCHIFTLFSHNHHDHARIRVLVNIFSTRFSNLKKKLFCCFSHPLFWCSNANYEIMHAENEKPDNEQSSASLPLSHLMLRLSDTSLFKDFLTKFTAFLLQI